MMKMKIRFKVIFLFLGLNLIALTVQAQSSFVDSKQKVGFQLGYGSHHLLNINYDYRVTFFQFQYFRSLVRKSKWGLDVVVQPQFNLMRYRFSTAEPALKNGIEYGLNAGALIRYNLNEGKQSLFLSISAGPHYVSGAPRRQSSGFIFSDNLFIGLQTRLKANLYADIRVGGRHISNANLETPNGGVNTLFFSAGLCWSLPN